MVCLLLFLFRCSLFVLVRLLFFNTQFVFLLFLLLFLLLVVFLFVFFSSYLCLVVVVLLLFLSPLLFLSSFFFFLFWFFVFFVFLFFVFWGFLPFFFFYSSFIKCWVSFYLGGGHVPSSAMLEAKESVSIHMIKIDVRLFCELTVHLTWGKRSANSHTHAYILKE